MLREKLLGEIIGLGLVIALMLVSVYLPIFSTVRVIR
jgi:type II secretory pathway component PulF